MAQTMLGKIAEYVNEIDELLRDYEATVDSDRQGFLIRRTLVTCCELLNSVDTSTLRTQVSNMLEQADAQAPDWRQQIFGNDDTFGLFLNIIERKLLEKAGFSVEATSRILDIIGRLREFAIYQSEQVNTDSIITSVETLRRDICQQKEQKIQEGTEEEKEKARKKIVKNAVKTLAASAIVVNVVGPFVFPVISLPIAAASATLGGAAQFVD